MDANFLEFRFWFDPQNKGVLKCNFELTYLWTIINVSYCNCDFHKRKLKAQYYSQHISVFFFIIGLYCQSLYKAGVFFKRNILCKKFILWMAIWYLIFFLNLVFDLSVHRRILALFFKRIVELLAPISDSSSFKSRYI